ncbi:asparagine-tRNA ligase [Tieghemostelium lacteum]|uniref:asparagine--tRNA ligase n=1 Tax=Tieghemostelium lacteum TaxID=361077 RepID=A0A152A2R3_TIELA|nr:asparagine-tRNA ligase [Tieghemostelium lacteum]|eukprot:KYR00516.1 asparagine-tRNA ligase [Tieghemostelium lacteum]
MAESAELKLFLAIGLDNKRAVDTTKNPELTATLKSIISEGGVESGCDKAIGNLLYSLATNATASSPLRSHVSKAIGNGKIKSTLQFQAATTFLKDNQTWDEAKFDKDCGVGVVITLEQIQKATDDLFVEKAALINEKKWHIPIGDLLTPLKERLKWADLKEVKAILDKKLDSTLGPKPVESTQKKAPQPTPTTTLEKAIEQIKLVENSSLPAAKTLKIRDVSKYPNQRVSISGWIHHSRTQKNLAFIELRDGTGFLQCVLAGDLVHPSIVTDLKREATITIVGTLTPPPENKSAQGGLELLADYWKLVGSSHADLEGILNTESNVDQLFDQRHIQLRGKKASSIMKLRSIALQAFRQHFYSEGYYEMNPPTMVNNFCEGSTELFSFDYFGQPAYLTQSSQLYLETMLPVMGDSFCIAQSYRAEKARTRRHLTEFTHLEVECPFITYDELLNRIEYMVCDVVERMLKIDKELFLSVNPNAKVPKRPFMRMNYSDAIVYCQKNGIKRIDENGQEVDFQHGDDIPEAQERKMNDQIGEPIFLCRFPAEMKAFYMARCPEDNTLTESTDLLMPGVGEIVGGSMRISNYDELIKAYKREELDPSNYYWFTDQRKYGTTPHGGYGLGVDRFLTWVLAEEHIRNVVSYPRYLNRCSP